MPRQRPLRHWRWRERRRPGGHYRNNNVSNIRIAGANSTIKDVKVVVDHNDVDHLNQRDIRLDAGSNVMVNNADIQLTRPNGDALSVLSGIESATITDTSIYMGDRPSRGINVSANTGPVRIADTEITSTGADEGGNAIALQGGASGEAASVIVENTTVTGNASGATGGREAILASRDNVTFRELTVDQPGTNLRQGINIGGDNCNVVNSTVSARHYPLVVRGENTLVQGSRLESLGGY
ncbi:hypothetical protein [Halorarum salinum]|uniref:Right handed beta helix domain-containing protein n=1 Tax=Halorarum salinum TaxID=2743089 RepID=A0A7D5QF36_9EURY|nr:hypothetical protein [Halobaculum salinum]QLG60364.1 hypothetical protein HUG12_00785 [Halobaculum salinum]